MPLLLLALSVFFPSFASAGWSDQLGSLNSDAQLPSADIADIILGLLLFVLEIFTVLSVLAFAIYGLMFLFGGANKESADSAKKGISYAIIGVIVGISGYIIITFITDLLNDNLVF